MKTLWICFGVIAKLNYFGGHSMYFIVFFIVGILFGGCYFFGMPVIPDIFSG